MSTCSQNVQQARNYLQTHLRRHRKPNYLFRGSLCDISPSKPREVYSSCTIGNSLQSAPSYTLSKTRYKYPVIEKLLYTDSHHDRIQSVQGHTYDQPKPRQKSYSASSGTQRTLTMSEVIS